MSDLEAYRSDIADYFSEAVAADDTLVKECKRVRDLPQPRVFVTSPRHGHV